MTTPLLPEERRQRLRAYVQENATQGAAHALSLARAEWQRLDDLIRDVSQTDADFYPGNNDWTIAQVMQHLGLSFSYNVERITSMSAGIPFTQPPYLAGQLPDESRPGEHVPPFVEIRARFRHDVASLGALVEQRTPPQHLDLTAAHIVFGPYNWVEWVVHSCIHVRDHIGQIEKNLALIKERKA